MSRVICFGAIRGNTRVTVIANNERRQIMLKMDTINRPRKKAPTPEIDIPSFMKPKPKRRQQPRALEWLTKWFKPKGAAPRG